MVAKDLPTTKDTSGNVNPPPLARKITIAPKTIEAKAKWAGAKKG